MNRVTVLFLSAVIVACGSDRIIYVPVLVYPDAGTPVVFDGGTHATDGGRSRDGGTLRPDAGSPPEVSLYRDNYGLTVWTEQMVTEVYETPNPWSALVQRLLPLERGHEPPLQSEYVNFFNTLEELFDATVSAYDKVGRATRSISLSTVWHMWEGDDSWPARFRAGVLRLQQTGYEVRLALLHKELHSIDLIVENDPSHSGWAHPNAVARFVAYVQSVLTVMGSTLPANSLMYLSFEAETALWEGYVSSGKWPPGATANGHALAQALINLRDALRQSASLVRAAGFRPAVAVSVSPLLLGAHHLGEGLLEYLRTWWLADSLILGTCRADYSPFDPNCPRENGSVINNLGITFYDGIWSHSDHVPFGLPGMPDEPLAMLVPRLGNDAALFQDVLGTAKSMYAQTTIEVAEIGFSNARIDTQRQNLINFKLAWQCKGIDHATFHTLFMGTTEFERGDWQFGVVENCGRDLECLLTERGEQLLDEISYAPISNPCNP